MVVHLEKNGGFRVDISRFYVDIYSVKSREKYRYRRKILSLGRTFGEVLPRFLHFYVAELQQIWYR